MAYDILQSSTQSALVFLMVQSSDHITGLTGASPTVTISKNGAAFGSVSGAITEISSGWYKVAGNATDTGTLGPLALHATAASGDPTDILVANIVSYNPQSATNLGLSGIPTANPGAANGIFIAGANVATSIVGTAASGATPAVAALTLTGGAASTTGGGVASAALLVTGGAGAGSTNGAIDGAVFAGGGTNTVASTASGIKTSGTSTGHGLNAQSGAGATGDGILAKSNATAGNGMTLTHNGSAVNDLNATTTPLTLAKTTNITGFNDIAATAVVSSGAITTSGGAVSTVTTVTNQLTAAQVATGVWQDATAGDFTTTSSIGKSLYTSGVVPGGTNGLFIAGTNAATAITTGLTAHIIGTVDTVTTTTTATNLTNAPTAGDFTATMKTSLNAATPTVTTGTISSGAVNAASINADTGLILRANTATAAAAGSLTLDAGATTTVDYYKDCWLVITSSTGIGQARRISTYSSGRVASVTPNWATTPSATSTFTILPQGYVDLAAILGTASTGAAGSVGIDWGQVANPSSTVNLSATTTNLVNTVTTYTGNMPQTGDSFARIGTAGVGLTNLGDSRIANLDATVSSRSTLTQTQVTGGAYSVQSASCVLGDARIAHLDADVSSRMATYTQPTGFLAATFPSGTVANTTNITAGTITTATNLTNAPTAGDFTAAMKTSLNAATPAVTVSDKTGFSLTAAYDFAKGTVAMAESYPVLGATITPAQALYELVQQSGEMSISSTTMTVKKRDQSTSAKTFTLNSATTPSAITEAS